MVVAPKPKPKPYAVSQRRVPDVRNFKRDSYHPNCYVSQEEVKARQFNEKKKDDTINSEKKKIPLMSRDLIRSITLPDESPKIKKTVFDKEAFDQIKNKAKVPHSYMVL